MSEHRIHEIKNCRVTCTCNWFFEDEYLQNYGVIGRSDKLMDAHSDHVAVVRAFKCVECGKDRREHETSHKWRVE